PLALMLADRLPGRVRGVILCSTFVRAPLPNAGWLRLATITPTVWLVRTARRVPARVFRPRSLPLAGAQAMTWPRVSSRVIAERARAILALDVREMLGRCAAPLLYLAATRDRVVPRRNAEEIARARPGVRVATIDGGHLALFTNAGAAAQTITGFIRE